MPNIAKKRIAWGIAIAVVIIAVILIIMEVTKTPVQTKSCRPGYKLTGDMCVWEGASLLENQPAYEVNMVYGCPNNTVEQADGTCRPVEYRLPAEIFQFRNLTERGDLVNKYAFNSPITSERYGVDGWYNLTESGELGVYYSKCDPTIFDVSGSGSSYTCTPKPGTHAKRWTCPPGTTPHPLFYGGQHTGETVTKCYETQCPDEYNVDKHGVRFADGNPYPNTGTQPYAHCEIVEPEYVAL